MISRNTTKLSYVNARCNPATSLACHGKKCNVLSYNTTPPILFQACHTHSSTSMMWGPMASSMAEGNNPMALSRHCKTGILSGWQFKRTISWMCVTKIFQASKRVKRCMIFDTTNSLMIDPIDCNTRLFNAFQAWSSVGSDRCIKCESVLSGEIHCVFSKSAPNNRNVVFHTVLHVPRLSVVL